MSQIEAIHLSLDQRVNLCTSMTAPEDGVYLQLNIGLPVALHRSIVQPTWIASRSERLAGIVDVAD
jgi:hypothetical protein